MTEDDSEGGVDLRQMLKRKQDLETVEIEKTSSKRRRKDRGAKSQYDVEESGQSPVIRPLMSKVVSPVEHHKSHHKKKKHRERSPGKLLYDLYHLIMLLDIVLLFYVIGYFISLVFMRKLDFRML